MPIGAIPAGAGETGYTGRVLDGEGGNPRGRGGDQYGRRPAALAAGQSPRARGRHGSSLKITVIRGAIPAGAGETGEHITIRWEERGNPRGRGGDLRVFPVKRFLEGQSPRARGRRQTGRRQLLCKGAIPAGAGETDGHFPDFLVGGGNPRGRGGDVVACASRDPPKGQSPRARGRHLSSNTDLTGLGAIPAGAGETSRTSSTTARRRGNPRGRGGDLPVLPVKTRAQGQSPRARGRLESPSPDRDRRGAIPAGAGETKRYRKDSRREGGNPRGRGGDTLPVRSGSTLRGQSPRARGRRGKMWNRRGSLRAIPAGAGETRRLLCCRAETKGNPRGRGGDTQRYSNL